VASCPRQESIAVDMAIIHKSWLHRRMDLDHPWGFAGTIRATEFEIGLDFELKLMTRLDGVILMQATRVVEIL
jgi:hypothetical protein